MWNGNVNNNNKTNNNYVWPVRLGEWLPPLFSFENLYDSYRRCRKRKRNTINALRFEVRAEEHLFALCEELETRTYSPSRSVCFVVERPKLREIIAADFRDRVVHHLLVDRLETFYERIFIHDSYACRKEKGIHRAVGRLKYFIRKGSQNGRRRLFSLHMDVKNFFMSIDRQILYDLLRKKVAEPDVLWLAGTIIFHNPLERCLIKGKPALFAALPSHKSLFKAPAGKGLPIGNLTSQFFANVYLNELDQYAKHTLKCRYYVRYCDDFVILDESPENLCDIREKIGTFLSRRLALSLNERYGGVHPLSKGIDFLGYIVRPGYTLVRRRAVNNLKTKLHFFETQLVREDAGLRIIEYDRPVIERMRSVIASYFGHFQRADTWALRQTIFSRHAYLGELLVYDHSSGSLDFCERTRRRHAPLVPVRAQYRYYGDLFKGAVLFFQVGRFYEFYEPLRPEVETLLQLKPLSVNRRGALYGFPVTLGDAYARRVAEKGLEVIIIKETERYAVTAKDRVPVMKISRNAGVSV